MLGFSPTTPRAPASMDTMIDFQRYGYSLVAHCNQHFRNHEFDIDKLIVARYGEISIITLKPVCSVCASAQKLVSPFHPNFTDYPRQNIRNDRFAPHFSRSNSKVQEGRTHVGYPQCDVIEPYYVKPKPSWNVYY